MFILRITGDLGFEVWKDVPEYEGIYQASTYGRFKSLKREKISVNRWGTYKCIIPETIMNAHIQDSGYRLISLSKDSVKHTYKVARLIAKTFLPVFETDMNQVNHKDENKSNDSVENLEWCTQDYNTNYGTRNERIKEKISKSVLWYDIEGNFFYEFKSLRAASEFTGCCASDISMCCRGLFRQTNGYVFKYKEDA